MITSRNFSKKSLFMKVSSNSKDRYFISICQSIWEIFLAWQFSINAFDKNFYLKMAFICCRKLYPTNRSAYYISILVLKYCGNLQCILSLQESSSVESGNLTFPALQTSWLPASIVDGTNLYVETVILPSGVVELSKLLRIYN